MTQLITNTNVILAHKIDTSEQKIGAIILSTSKDTIQFQPVILPSDLKLDIKTTDRLIAADTIPIYIDGTEYHIVKEDKILVVIRK